MTYQDWLESLKAGDTVIVKDGYHRPVNAYVVRKIAKVTATRQFVLDNGDRFKSNGTSTAAASSYSARDKIIPPTVDIFDSIERNVILRSLHKMKWDELSLAKLRNVRDILKVVEPS